VNGGLRASRKGMCFVQKPKFSGKWKLMSSHTHAYRAAMLHLSAPRRRVSTADCRHGPGLPLPKIPLLFSFGVCFFFSFYKANNIHES
jgi:hypothetical protein